MSCSMSFSLSVRLSVSLSVGLLVYLSFSFVCSPASLLVCLLVCLSSGLFVCQCEYPEVNPYLLYFLGRKFSVIYNFTLYLLSSSFWCALARVCVCRVAWCLLPLLRMITITPGTTGPLAGAHLSSVAPGTSKYLVRCIIALVYRSPASYTR